LRLSKKGEDLGTRPRKPQRGGKQTLFHE
jgi:hypothetical protein